MSRVQNQNRNYWIDYLRSAITVLVVAHHASLAYTTFATFDPTAYINSTNPIVDSKRWVGLDIFENFNDIFFMSLMFLIGGLFISSSIHKKGIRVFIKDRIYRLLIPFLFGGTLLMLIAYFPSYYVAHQSSNIIGYIKDFFTVEHWPVGPPWFIWVLFIFNVLLALTNVFLKNINTRIGQWLNQFQKKPVLFFFLLFLSTWLLYVPIAYNIDAGTWTGFGPFDFQLSRILLYFGYFMFGVWIGNADFNQQLFSKDAAVVKKWKWWIVFALLLYTIITLNGELHILEQLVIDKKLPAFTAWMIYYTVYAASCAASCIAFIATIRHRINRKKKWWTSLSENAYLIYMLHYIFITWMQFGLLSFDIPALIKFILTFTLSLLLSWLLSIQLRKINLIKKYL